MMAGYVPYEPRPYAPLLDAPLPQPGFGDVEGLAEWQAGVQAEELERYRRLVRALMQGDGEG